MCAKTVLKTICNFISTFLVIFMTTIALLLWGVRLFGIDLFVVQSGSMEPIHPTGSMVYVKETDPSKLQVGDVITFTMTDGVRGTHRIIEIVPDEEDPTIIHYRTKGDANEHADFNLVEAEDIVGKVLFSIPYLGFLIAFIQQPPGIYAAGSLAVCMFAFICLSDVLFREPQKAKRQEAYK